MDEDLEMRPAYTTRTICRACGSSELDPLFSLGDQYVSAFVPESDVRSEVRCPIEIELCRSCSLVQAKHAAPQDLLYTRHYWFRSGTSPTMRAALADVAAAAERIAGLRAGDVVMDLGSNDGTLLRSYRVQGLAKVAVEPARNLAEEGSRGVDYFIGEFWSASAYYSTIRRQAKVITACGMLYDLEDPNQFVADIAQVLSASGIFIAQLMCLKQTVEQKDVGNFTHEHLELWSLQSLARLLAAHGLEIFRVEENDVNGGSYRLYARHRGAGIGTSFTNGSVDRALAAESKIQLDQPATYKRFFSALEANRNKCVAFVRKAAAEGKLTWVRGASTKGNVILQWYGLDRSLVEGAADADPAKRGLFTVGTGIPIRSLEEGRLANPDYYLVLPYAFLSEIMDQDREWHRRGGRFLVPLPKFRIV